MGGWVGEWAGWRAGGWAGRQVGGRAGGWVGVRVRVKVGRSRSGFPFGFSSNPPPQKKRKKTAHFALARSSLPCFSPILWPRPASPWSARSFPRGMRPEDAKVAGFLPIDWNGDGKMDLLIGPWGLGHLKYFEAGWCDSNDRRLTGGKTG